MADVGPVAAGFWRLAIATPVLFAMAVAMGGKPVAAARGLWGVLAIAGVAFAADLGSWHVGILHTTLANSTLFGNSATLIFPIYGFIAARMWPTRLQGLALLLAAIGAGMLLGRSASLSADNLTGDLLCPLSSIATIPPLLLAALAMGEQVMPGNWGPVIVLAVVSQLIGQGCMIYALGHLSPLLIGIGLLIQPVVAAGLGWSFFDERLAAADILGAALVATALVLVRSSEVASAPEKPRSA
jgi:drug/metabolite transporter (DMT)-like permease